MATNVTAISDLPPVASDKPAPAGSTTLGKDEFLKLFMAQLGHQDPTAPMDSQAFVTQLAQFASLELQQNTNQHLESIMIGQAAAQQTSVTNLVGKDVLYRTGSLELTQGQITAVEAQIAADAANVTAVITNDSGKVVRTMQLGSRSAGTATIPWDGRDDAGNLQPSGHYKIEVTASDVAGAKVEVEQRREAHVTGISFENGVPELLLGSQRIKLSDVIEINERTTT